MKTLNLAVLILMTMASLVASADAKVTYHEPGSDNIQVMIINTWPHAKRYGAIKATIKKMEELGCVPEQGKKVDKEKIFCDESGATGFNCMAICRKINFVVPPAQQKPAGR